MVAYWLGDPTAKYEGRLTLNPIAHLDPLGTLLFMVAGFGWGKPVPVNPLHFKHPKRDTALVSIAGPVSNLILAFIALFGLKIVAPQLLSDSGEGLMNAVGSGIDLRMFLAQIFTTSLYMNLGLMAFNLLPIAPLDGSKILAAFIPYQYEDTYLSFMQRGPYILLFLLLAERVLKINILFAWIYGIMNPVLHLMSLLV